jgi:rare lipoprotein A
MTLVLVSCQKSTDIDNPSTLSKPVVYSSKPNKTLIYDRYKNKHHRYTKKHDSAPKKIKKPISFKEPVPVKEPLSRYGNPSEYDVGGHRYEVMKNSTGYKTKGIASWYGTKFHKQRTSSGEPYDMYTMTAAHKTLPLPTYVKVKNLNNGREVVVKVNDRGPFHQDRLIDLSYAAALKLGVFPKGTAPVEIETIMGPVGKAHYYLQAGAFSSEILASQLKQKLAHLTPSPVFIERYKKRYMVRVGPFADKNMVNMLKQKLAHNGVLGSFSMMI